MPIHNKIVNKIVGQNKIVGPRSLAQNQRCNIQRGTCKASCKSIKIKLEVLEKELNDLNHLKEKNQQLIKQNEKLRADLTNS